MLLWHDSLGYRDVNYFAVQYPGYAGTPTAGNPHVIQGSKALGGTFAFSTPVRSPAPSVQDGSEACIVGFLLRIESPSAIPVPYSTLLEVRRAGTVQIRMMVVQNDTSSFNLQVQRGNNDDILLTTKPIAKNEWVFVEIKSTILLSGGKVIIHLNGTEFARVEGVKTETDLSVNRYWDSVKLSCQGYLADLYVLDGRLTHGKSFATFLGRVKHSKIACGAERVLEWANHPNPTNKYRIVVLAGQSNFTGRGLTTSSANWRSPNTKIKIWDRITHAYPGQWDDIKPTANTSGMFLVPPISQFWGPEMRFAERVCQFYEAAAFSGNPNVRIVKCDQDGSYLFPAFQDYTWDKNTPNNLYSGNPNYSGTQRGGLWGTGPLPGDLPNAVTSIAGGWASIERVDFMWYQGESDSVFQVSADSYLTRLLAFFAQVDLDIPVPVTFHLVRIHRDSAVGPGPNLGGAWFKEVVRAAQDQMPQLRTDVRAISVDDCEMHPDQIHLSNNGYDKLGDKCFESWMPAQNFSSYIDDYATLSFIDDLWIGSSANKPASRALFAPSGREGTINAPVVAASSQMHAESVAPGISITPRLSDYSFSSHAVASLLNLRQSVAGIKIPEKLDMDVGCQL